jgi:hypothetical protein
LRLTEPVTQLLQTTDVFIFDCDVRTHYCTVYHY